MLAATMRMDIVELYAEQGKHVLVDGSHVSCESSTCQESLAKATDPLAKGLPSGAEAI